MRTCAQTQREVDMQVMTQTPIWCFVTVADLRAKVKFSQQTKTALLRPNYGRWRWRVGAERPSWNALKTAPLWKDDEHMATRGALLKPPATVQAADTGDSALRQLLFNPPGTPDRTVTLTVYDASEESVPPAMQTLLPRGALVLLDGSNFLSAQIRDHLESTATMLFGTPHQAQCMVDIITHNMPSRVTQTIWVYIKPLSTDPRQHTKFVERTLVLVGDEALLKFQVFLSTP